MTVRETVLMGDPALRTPCREVADPAGPETAALARDLADTLDDWYARTGYGRGIAAPQVGAGLRVVCLRWPRREVLVNPRVVRRSAENTEWWDGCLSFSLAFFVRTRRSAWVEVVYRDASGAERELRADGDLAELLQHEIDHLDGVLAVDRMTDPGSMCMRSEFERRHRAESPYRP